MTHLLTFRAIANTDSDLAFISVTETTSSLLFATSDEADGYNDAAVARILKAKNAKTNIAFTNGDEFLDWLHR
jgi:addiction module RelE/StbE family toxin